MPASHRTSSKAQFWIRSGVLLIVVGVAGTLLPMFGLQLRKLQGIPLGVWTGVPFIAIGLAMIGLSFVAQRHPKLVKRAFIGAGVALVGLIALGVLAPILAGTKPGGASGGRDGSVDDLARRHGVELAEPVSTPGAAGKRWGAGAPSGPRGPRGIGPGREPPEPPPMPEGSWSIFVEQRITHEEEGPIREALRALGDGASTQYQRSQRGDRTTFRIGPIADEPALRAALERFGVIDAMDSTVREIRMTITTLDP
ncbi:MAG: hypothetical protein ACTS3F_08935 [Phycisphaerales bacterium]